MINESPTMARVPGSSPTPRCSRWLSAIRSAVLLSLVAVLLPACNGATKKSSEPVEVTGSIDAYSLEERGAIYKRVASSLKTGIGTYPITVGDEIEVTYHIGNNVATRAYRLGISDEIEVDFRAQPEYSRRVSVRPDGKISLIAKGDMMALGKEPEQLAREIEATYNDILVDPLVTVIVQKFQTPDQDLKELLQNGAAQRAKTVLVEPDGKINLPLLHSVQAAGHTVADLGRQLDRAYGRTLVNVSTSVRLASLAPNTTFVFGEVKNPGPVATSGPRSVVQMIAAAGGFLPGAAPRNVRVITPDASGTPRVVEIDVEKMLEEGAAGGDILVPPMSTVYVPPSDLAKAARLIDLVVRQLFLFNGTSLGISYAIDDN